MNCWPFARSAVHLYPTDRDDQINAPCDLVIREILLCQITMPGAIHRDLSLFATSIDYDDATRCQIKLFQALLHLDVTKLSAGKR